MHWIATHIPWWTPFAVLVALTLFTEWYDRKLKRSLEDWFAFRAPKKNKVKTMDMNQYEECTACEGDGDGGRDSEGYTLACDNCGGSGKFTVKTDPVLMRKTLVRVE